MKTFLEKRDLKALSTLSLMSNVKVLNEDHQGDNKVMFITSFGIVIPEKILNINEMPEVLNKENYPGHIVSSAIKNVKETLIENKNDDILDNQTAFALEKVKIIPFNSNATHNLLSMILFSQDILGLSFGNLSVD